MECHTQSDETCISVRDAWCVYRYVCYSIPRTLYTNRLGWQPYFSSSSGVKMGMSFSVIVAVILVEVADPGTSTG